jgi:hypothetical protein
MNTRCHLIVTLSILLGGAGAPILAQGTQGQGAQGRAGAEPLEVVARRLQEKVAKVGPVVRSWAAAGGDHRKVAPLGQRLDQLLRAKRLPEAERVVDQILAMVGAQAPRRQVADLEYRSPYRAPAKDHDFLLSQGSALYSAKADGSGDKSLLLTPPAGWTIRQSSISPNHQRLLLTMAKPSTPAWPDPLGRSGSWGRLTLWLAYHAANDPKNPADDEWVFRNLAPVYGRNADVHGWTSWQNNSLALFNGLIRPENEELFPGRQESNTAQAYQLRFVSNQDVRAKLWGGVRMARPDSLTGRLFASRARSGESCAGQRVIFARRTYGGPRSKESHAWWNTKNLDGTGGKFLAREPSLLVPVLRVFVVETDASGQPKTAPRTPVQKPRTEAIYRHMGNVPEWGDMQPCISRDGRRVAFHTMKGYDDSDPKDASGSFRHSGGAGSRVFYCELDQSLRSKATRQVAPPEDLTMSQGQPFFLELGQETSIVLTEGNGKLTQVVRIDVDRRPQVRTVLCEGIGGYPLK